jgi:hypothetical protein
VHRWHDQSPHQRRSDAQPVDFLDVEPSPNKADDEDFCAAIAP